MRIVWHPQRRGDALAVTKTGDVVTINGEAFDFSPLPDGATLPQEAIPCDLIAGPVERVDGHLIVPLILPHGPQPGPAVAFPAPLDDVPDGSVELPQ